MNDLEKILDKLENVKKTGENYTAKCPIHNDSTNSLSIFKTYDGNYIPYCHTGICSYQELKQVLGLTAKTFKDKGIVEIYQYYKPDGSENFQNVRYFPKDFRQRRKSGESWVWDLKGIDVTPYRLPELLASDYSRAVFYCEGEKDANRLASLGLISISGKWKDSFKQWLENRVVYVLRDNDESGKGQGLKIAQNLFGFSKSIKLVDFNDKLAKDKGDVSDFLDEYGLEDLKELIKSTKEYSPSVKEFESAKIEQAIPASPELELAIIDSCLSDNTLIAHSLDILSNKAFYLPFHKKAFEAMVESFETQGFIDKNLLLDKLAVTENPELVKQLSSSLKNSLLSYYTFILYCKVIQHKYKIRSLINHCDYITIKAKEDVDGSIFDEAEERLFALNEDSIANNGEFENFGSVVTEVISNAEVFSNSGNQLLGLSTGYQDLDSFTSGLQKSDLIIVAARPSMGKTALVLDIANNTIENNNNVVIFTLEMSKAQIVTRMMCQNLELKSEDLRKGNLSQHQWEQVHQFKANVVNSNIAINAMPGINVLQMRRALRRYVAKKGPLDLIIVDYLQLMNGDLRKSENRVQEITKISRELKETARIFNSPLIAVSQLSRKPDERKASNFKPIMSDLRDSGSIEQDADIIAFLYREDYYNQHCDYPGLTEIMFSKNRNGPVGHCYLQFQKDFTHFENSTITNTTDF